MSDERRKVTFQQKMTKINQKILLGIFDSGIGGFSVLHEIRKKTKVDIFYFGDCARAPYGNRAEEEILLFIKEILCYLQLHGVTHFVSACNSMSVLTTEKLLHEVGIMKDNYIDMVDAVKILSFPPSAKVLILGTQATINSNKYQNILKEKKVTFDVFSPVTLAGDIEKGNVEAIVISLKEVLTYALASDVTHILYACTHYPLIDTMFKNEALHSDWSGEFVDPAVYIADEVAKWTLAGSGKVTFKTSLETDIFKEYSEKTW